MNEILMLLKAVEPVGIAILIWRQRVADSERAELLQAVTKNQEYLEGLIKELLTMTKS